MNKTVAMIVTCALLIGTVPVLGIPPGPPEIERTWASGSDQWDLFHNKEPIKANDMAHADLYIIAPVDSSNPQSTTAEHPAVIPAPHDHVITAPPHNGGEFTAIWHVMLVTDGSGKLVNKDSSGNLLTSDDAIDEAADKGDITLVDTGFVFTCAIRPHQ